MFSDNKDFFPTPASVIELMADGLQLNGKNVLEPSAGKGDIINFCTGAGANVFACETNKDLIKIISSKCPMLAEDFLALESYQVSHIDYIIMNPPFSADEKHILHAWEIAPAGCKVIALCNSSTIDNSYTIRRKKLAQVIMENGTSESLGDCFSDSERKTGVQVSLLKLQKPGAAYDSEFEGFFTEDDKPEEQGNGIMPYNFIRDLVNRYVEAIKIFDLQLELGAKMNDLTQSYFFSKKPELAMSVTRLSVPVKRNDFKKDMQKAGWAFVFDKMNMQKYATKGLKEDINKFVEQQQNIPFTMRNIYRMLDIVIGTQSQRMDKALLDVFEQLTAHHHDNRFNIEGWHSNSHYLLNEKVILPYMIEVGWQGEIKARYTYSNTDIVEDMIKALCYITGDNYDNHISFKNFLDYPFKLKRDGKYMRGCDYLSSTADGLEKAKKDFYEKGIATEIEHSKAVWGQWIDWGFFEIRCYKKGTVHFKFKNDDVCAQFNQHVARLKGYPLFEGKTRKAA